MSVNLQPQELRTVLNVTVNDAEGQPREVRVTLALVVVVADEGRYVAASQGNPQGLVDYLASGVLLQQLITQTLATATQSGWQMASLLSETSTQGLESTLGNLAAQTFAPFGVRVLELRTFQATAIAAAAAAAPAAPAASADAVYEMLWNCRSCGADGLLGLTHRHCPNCGSPQDPSSRYFPTDDKKVAVRDHRFVGVDRRCRFCSTANGRASNCCGTCGGPLAQGADLATRADQLHAVGQYAGDTAAAAHQERQPPVPTPKKPKKWALGCSIAAGVGLLLFTLMVVMCSWSKGAEVVVTGHSWTREINVERYGNVEKSTWCDQMPGGAAVKKRSREVRSHESTKTGETCKTRKIDRGDGTFKEKEECTPVYNDKAVYDERCSYDLREWSQHHKLKQEGHSLSEPLRWPSVALERVGTCLGCEREGTRSEAFVVHFKDKASPEVFECSFPEPRWRSLALKQTFKAKVAVVGKVLDCSSLSPY